MFATYAAIGFSIWFILVLFACAFIRGASERREDQQRWEPRRYQ
ncbi:hypothetical protein [Paraburkholderia unamae]|uniref:Heme exporter protein D n=1 Tax=Paraburkholderia unamae TaxID=219649 RepID=A0ABX5K6W2_9BURK|nr:hypothetical protein [Paraburkholderia unamae]PVX61271.1 hypothetical protein C7402_14264 [Paraburkholderia unamae]